MRLLVTGGAGMLGQAVAAAATRLGHEVIALSRAELDVTDAEHAAGSGHQQAHQIIPISDWSPTMKR